MSLLEMKGINKSFNGVPVLKNAQLSVEQGEVHALLGENGAGKSTMMNILTGTIPMDSGSIYFDGQEMKNITIPKSEEAGIAFVHQELNLFNDLRVYENIFIGKEYTGALGKLKKKDMIREAGELFEKLQIHLDPTAMVADLKTSQKQLLEISKALYFKAKLLILDEPTTALNNEEVEHLFDFIGKLKTQGISFIFISHKMPEIFQYSDSYTVMRNGEYIGTGPIKDTNPGEVTKLMVGRDNTDVSYYQPREEGKSILEIRDISGDGFSHVSLDVRKGEVVGLTGLEGSGSSEVLGSLFGLRPRTGGTVLVNGKSLKDGSIHAAMEAGVALLPSNRKENSVIPDMTILENMVLAEQTLSARHFQIHRKQDHARYEEFHKMLNIKAESPDMPVTSLSGGNQQKVFLARWLDTNAEILLLDNPTQGIDVGAKAEIYRLILELAKQGKTILVNTLEIPELQKIADRVAVFCDGKIETVLPHDEITEHKVMMYSTGAVPQESPEAGGVEA